MLVEIMEVSENDAFSVNRADLVGCVFEVHPMDVIEWKDGWFGVDKCRLVSGPTGKSRRLFDGFDNCFHEIKFEEVIPS